jgi:lipid-A-disaccharide synthase-like uncharacterized protein
VTPLEVFGQVGNALFFSRWVVQWIASERAQETRAPKSFFWLSLAGTAILFTYTLARGEMLLLASYTANLVFYSRNLALAYRPKPTRGWLAHSAMAFALALFAVLLVRGATSGRNQAESGAWLACGVTGQVVFGSRFAVQWWFSEVRGKAHFPQLFWWLSLGGCAFLLAYALHTGDWVWIVGQLTAWVLPLRMIALELKRRPARVSDPLAPAAAGTRACRRPAER